VVVRTFGIGGFDGKQAWQAPFFLPLRLTLPPGPAKRRTKKIYHKFYILTKRSTDFF
jgi:hypothetical protein